MSVNPTPFDRSTRLSQPAQMTEGQLLELQNKIWDLQQEQARSRDVENTQNSVLAEHDAALTRFDDERHSQVSVTRFARQPDQPAPAPIRTIADMAVDPKMEALDDAFQKMADGILIYLQHGIDDDPLSHIISAAVRVADLRHAHIPSAGR